MTAGRLLARWTGNVCRPGRESIGTIQPARLQAGKSDSQGKNGFQTRRAITGLNTMCCVILGPLFSGERIRLATAGRMPNLISIGSYRINRKKRGLPFCSLDSLPRVVRLTKQQIIGKSRLPLRSKTSRGPILNPCSAVFV